jgi:hypothetical protein
MKPYFYINFVVAFVRLYLVWFYGFLYRLFYAESRWCLLEDSQKVGGFLFFLSVILVLLSVGFGWDVVMALDMSAAQVSATLASTFVYPRKCGFGCLVFLLEDQESCVYLWFFL